MKDTPRTGDSHTESESLDKINVLFQETENLNTDTQDTISGEINDITAKSGDKMSSNDVKKTTDIIEVFLEDPDLDISETTLQNLISTVDNIQTLTETEELRQEETSDLFRESAVLIVSEVARGDTGITFVSKESVGKLAFDYAKTLRQNHESSSLYDRAHDNVATVVLF